jgi:hypothetical protein
LNLAAAGLLEVAELAVDLSKPPQISVWMSGISLGLVPNPGR